MPFTREQLLAEAQKRGLQVPSVQAPAQPAFSKEQLLAEAQRRGLTPPPSNGKQAAFNGVDEFQDAYAPQVSPQPIPEDVPFGEDIGQAPAPAAPERGFGEKLTGAAETALSMFTGATGGTAGMMAGFVKGVYDAVSQGKFGEEEGADMIEKEAMRMSGELTYAPRTEAGQEYSKEIGEALAPMQAVGPMGIQRGGAQARQAGRVMEPKTPTKKAPEAPVTPAPAAPVTPSVKAMAPEALGKTTAKATEGIMKAKHQKILAEQAMPDPEVVASAKRLGVEEYLQPDHVTTNQTYRELAQATKSMPGSEARQVELVGLEQVAKRADTVIDEMGGATDWSMLSDNVKTRLQSIQDDLWKTSEKLYGDLKNNIPAKGGVTTDNITGWLLNQADELGGVDNLSPIEKTVLKRMSVKDGKQPSYALLDRTRKDLTAARVKGQGVFKDADTGMIKKLEKELLKDQQAAAEKHGMAETFDAARKAVATRKSIESDMIGLFGKQLDKSLVAPLTSGIKKISQGDVSIFKKTIDKIPEEMRKEVVATSLETAFGRKSVRGDLSFNTFANWYENAQRNKAAFNEVSKYLPKESKQQLNDIYNVFNGIRNAAKERITTGRLLSVQESLEGADSLIGKIYSGAKPAAIGLLGDVAGASGLGTLAAVQSALKGPKAKPMIAADKLIASKEFQNLARENVTLGAPKPQTLNSLTKSKAFKRYAKSIGGLAVAPELWIMEAMKPEAVGDEWL